jgi:peptidoglycan/LPS O-acetylase OafA/YrhL
LAVLVGHSYLLSGANVPVVSHRPLYALVSNLGAGVWLFFGLSGYLIGGPYLAAFLAGQPAPRLRTYTIRRVVRIYPAYLAALAFVLAVGATGVHRWSLPFHALLLHNLIPGEQRSVFFPAWTLTLEILFYAFVPAVAWAVQRGTKGALSRRTIAWGVAAVWVASTGWTLGAGLLAGRYPGTSLYLRFVFPGVLAMFCPGLLVYLAETSGADGGRWVERYRALVARRGAVGLLAALLALLGAVLASTYSVVVYDLARVPFAVASGLLVGLAVDARPWSRMALGVLAPLGLVSYGIYLWQGGVMAFLVQHPGLVPLRHEGLTAWAVHAAMLLSIVVVVAVVSWVVLERPAIAFGQRRSQALRS